MSPVLFPLWFECVKLSTHFHVDSQRRMLFLIVHYAYVTVAIWKFCKMVPFFVRVIFFFCMFNVDRVVPEREREWANEILRNYVPEYAFPLCDAKFNAKIIDTYMIFYFSFLSKWKEFIGLFNATTRIHSILYIFLWTNTFYLHLPTEHFEQMVKVDFRRFLQEKKNNKQNISCALFRLNIN